MAGGEETWRMSDKTEGRNDVRQALWSEEKQNNERAWLAKGKLRRNMTIVAIIMKTYSMKKPERIEVAAFQLIFNEGGREDNEEKL